MTQPNPSPDAFMQQNERNAWRTRSPRGKSPSGRMSQGRAPIHSVKSGTLQNACSTRPRAVADLGNSARMHIRQVDEQPTKRSKKNDDKSAVAILKKNDLNESVWNLL